MSEDEKLPAALTINAPKIDVAKALDIRDACRLIAMDVVQEFTRSSRVSWTFRGRREMEIEIEKQIKAKLYADVSTPAPRVKLTYDRKTKRVDLVLNPGWKGRLNARESM